MKIDTFFNRINPPKKPSTSLIPYKENVELLPLFNLKPSTKSQMKSQKQRVTSNESALKMEEYADQVATILLEKEKILLNKTRRTPNIRWPITTPRDEHKDNDVFIARANNPFGHSTKWKFRYRY
jgi:hypothetical protein